MNNDIRKIPPRPQPQNPQARPDVSHPSNAPVVGFQPRANRPAPLNPQQPTTSPVDTTNPVDPQPPQNPKPRRKKWLKRLVLILLAAALIVSAASLAWYVRAQRPVHPDATERVEFRVESGMTPNQIGALLKEKDLIRSETAFALYTRVNSVRDKLQAGQYRLAPSETLGAIVDSLTQGQAASFNITFYPGATLFDPTDIEDGKRTDVYTMLRRAGYNDQEVRSAISKQYDHPIFEGKPASASIEGYVFGETYQFDTSATAEEVLVHSFDVFYEKITEADIISQLSDLDMNLYEGITLASIVEREVSGRAEDQAQVSQIFHLRLEEGISLGADATFVYAAQQNNDTPTINYDSPYNTRINTGLPPGPIASPGFDALEATASPASGDYLFFVSADDGTSHFARTNAEHEENTRKYCTTLCTGTF